MEGRFQNTVGGGISMSDGKKRDEKSGNRAQLQKSQTIRPKALKVKWDHPF